MANPDFIEAQKYLSGIDYPATKGDLVERARSQDAGEDVVQALERIPDREYDGPNAVSEEIARG
jgi:Protein of unknown function (DUF2795)